MNRNDDEKIAELAKKLTGAIMPAYKDYHTPAELTTNEKYALKLIKNEFEKEGIDFSQIRFRRRSDSYLTLLSPDGTDFCRIKAGIQAFWFSVDCWRMETDDVRFKNVKNKNMRHWKVQLNCIEDFGANADLIVECYKSIVDIQNHYDITETQPDFDDVEISDVKTFSKFNLGTTIRENISDYTVIDIETTGKYVNNCEIIELSAVRVRNSLIVDKYSTLIKPKKKVPAVITELTGITDEMLENAPSISEKLPEYLDFIGDDVILGHNIATFDRHIISRYCSELGLPLLENDTLDTLQYAHCCDVDVPDYRLTTLTAFFGISHSNAHRALADCIANFECYEKLKGRFDGVYRSSPFNQSRERVEVDKNVLSEVTEKINLSGKSVCLTGAFTTGSRSSVQKQIENLGAVVVKGVSSKTDYLIVGGSGSADWKFGNYGGKVQKALEYQEKGKNIKIVSEEDIFSSEKFVSSTPKYSSPESKKSIISEEDLFDNTDTGINTTDVKEYIEQLDKKIMSKYNTPENFVKYFENSGNSSVYLVEPATNKKSQLVLNYRFKKFKGETIRYHSFAVKKSIVEFIMIPENAEIRDIDSDELNTYINFQTFDENVMNFIKSVVEYYVIHFEPKDKFGCCSKYRECSAAGECLHNNKFYSKACWYRKNLESGNIFY